VAGYAKKGEKTQTRKKSEKNQKKFEKRVDFSG
jgi:hypothetical protein